MRPTRLRGLGRLATSDHTGAVSAAAAKRTVLAAASILALVALSILVPTGGASSARRDSEPPTTPRNVRVAGATQSLVRIAWDPSTDNVGVKGYYVFGDKGKATVDVLDDQGKPILDDDGKPIGDAPGFTVEWLGCGESTELTVIAFDASQNRSGKATVTVSTAACGDLQPPTAPSAFTQVATSTDSVVLAWAASYRQRGRRRVRREPKPSASRHAHPAHGHAHGTVMWLDATSTPSMPRTPPVIDLRLRQRMCKPRPARQRRTRSRHRRRRVSLPRTSRRRAWR